MKHELWGAGAGFFAGIVAVQHFMWHQRRGNPEEKIDALIAPVATAAAEYKFVRHNVNLIEANP